MTQTNKFIILDWQEVGLDGTLKPERFRGNRQIVNYPEYPARLPCSNPDCENGGFEIDERVAALPASGDDSEQNSLTCSNAIHPDRSKRCRQIIRYSIACIRPYQRVLLAACRREKLLYTDLMD